jgi:DNA-binding NarL/FixJ family response regulator
MNRIFAHTDLRGSDDYNIHRISCLSSSCYKVTRAEVSMPSLENCEDRMAKKILVADDNPLIRKMLCRIFEAHEDYDLCAEAENGEEAIALSIKHRPDLVILDLEMPVMNGIDAAGAIKQVLPGVPIILFTQYADIAMGRAFTNLPVDRVVSKNEGLSLLGHIRSLLSA